MEFRSSWLSLKKLYRQNLSAAQVEHGKSRQPVFHHIVGASNGAHACFGVCFYPRFKIWLAWIILREKLIQMSPYECTIKIQSMQMRQLTV